MGFQPFGKKFTFGWLITAVALALTLTLGFLFALRVFDGGAGRVVVEFSKPDQVFVGQPFSVLVSLSNPSNDALNDVKLSLSVPEGVSFLGQPEDQRVLELSIGDIGPGSVEQPSVNLIALSGSQTLKRLATKLSYRTSASSAQFEERSVVDIVVAQSAVNLSVGIPQEIVGGEGFNVVLQYQNVSDQPFKDLELEIAYPSAFSFIESDPKPMKGNNSWKLADLEKGESGSITIRGRIIGPERSFFGFRARISAELFGRTYTISSQVANLAIAASPLFLEVTVNENTDYIAKLGDGLTYSLRYKNNSDITFENLTLRAQLVGSLFDFRTVSGKGFFNSLTNTFTWDVANNPKLIVLGPGQEGSVELSVRLADRFPVRRLGDKNFTLKAEAQVESPTVPFGTAAEKTISVASLENRVSGALEVDASGFFFDAASGFVNRGPYPPKVDQPTQYTIHWRIRNYAVDMLNVHVSSFLLSGSRWTGNVKSSIDVKPTYDPSSGRVTWDISSLVANKGIVGEIIEAVFQIENTPAVNQIGKVIPLMNRTDIQAEDTFTGLTLRNSDVEITTELPDDPGAKGMGHDVQP